MMSLRRRLLMQINRSPVIGDIWASATKTENVTLYSDGTERAENGMIVTDFVDVIQETDYTMTVTAGTTGARSRRFICYDANKTFISQLTSRNWMNTGQTASATVKMPSTAKYARVCAFKADSVSVIGLIP